MRMRWRTILRRVALATFAMLFSVTLLEICVRVFLPQDPGYYDSSKFTRTVADAPWFHENIPGSHSDSFVGVPVSINSSGLRGAETAVDKPPGTIRILGVGDSITFGYGVRQEDTFLGLLEDKLNRSAHHDRQYQVLNAGVGATGLNYYYYVLQTKARALRADVVIVNICLNDIHVYNETDLAKSRSRPGSKSRQRRVNEWFLRHSQLYLASYVPVKSLLYRLKVLDIRDIQGGTLLPLDPPSAQQERAWKSSLQVLSSIVEWSRKEHTRLLLVIFPVEMQLSGKSLQLYRDEFQLPLGSEVLSGEPQRRLREFGAASGVAVVDLLPALRAAGGKELFLRNKSINYDPVHPSVAGHQIAAEEIFRCLNGGVLETPTASGIKQRSRPFSSAQFSCWRCPWWHYGCRQPVATH